VKKSWSAAACKRNRRIRTSALMRAQKPVSYASLKRSKHLEVCVSPAKLSQDTTTRFTERWPSGRRRSPAKGVWALSPIEGSNPSLSTIIKGLRSVVTLFFVLNSGVYASCTEIIPLFGGVSPFGFRHSQGGALVRLQRPQAASMPLDGVFPWDASVVLHILAIAPGRALSH
jgi:hypothetical protein